MLNIFKKETPKQAVESISNIDSLVREGDNLFSDSLILLDEKLAGNLFCSEKIVVEQNGKLSGNITSKYCIISGTITGDILSTEEMQVKSTAIIKGNLKSALIHIEPGAIINGCITIAEDNNAVADLARKIQKYVTDECLEAKMVAEIAGMNKPYKPAFAVAAVQPQKKEDPKLALKAEIRDEPAYTQQLVNKNIKPEEKPAAIKAAESNNLPAQVSSTAQSTVTVRAQVLSAAKPAPKAEPEESNSRWW